MHSRAQPYLTLVAKLGHEYITTIAKMTKLNLGRKYMKVDINLLLS